MRFVFVSATTFAFGLVIACSSFSSDTSSTPSGDAGGDERPAIADAAADAREGSSVPHDAYYDAVMADSPIAYFRLGEKSGLVAHDETGTNDGIYEDNVLLGEPGAIEGNSAAKFDGTDGNPGGHVRIGKDFGQFVGTSALTIEAWVRFDRVQGAYPMLFTKIDAEDSGFSSGQWCGFGQSTLDLRCKRFDGAGNESVVSAPFPLATLTHFAYTYADGVMTLYIGGTRITPTTTTIGLTLTNADFVIGANPNGGEFLPGVVDEFAVYDHALTQLRIVAHIDAARAGHD